MVAPFEAVDFSVQLANGVHLPPLSLRIDAGQWTAWTGRNGSGKTTVLRACLGLFSSQRGFVFHFGRNRPDFDRAGVLFQIEQPSMLSVRRVVELGHRTSRHERRRTLSGHDAMRVDVDRVLLAFDLWDVQHEPARRLSGGEWQRTRLARTFVEPKMIYFLDEPTNHLDRGARDRVHQVLAQLMPRPSLLYVGHDRAMIDACDRWLDFTQAFEVGA
jgi:ABC-type Mn2+/Zn2+ transport system ATPase subunit